MEITDNLLKCLEQTDFSSFDEESIDSILDDRDNDPFYSEWERVSNELEELKNPENHKKSNEEEFLSITKRVCEILDDNDCGELSACVADDFGLIYDSLVLNFKDEWLDKLTAAYGRKIIPSGEI